MKKKTTKSKSEDFARVSPKWAGEGPYRRTQEMRFTIPVQFLRLCKLMDVPPVDVLHEFMVNTGCESFNRKPDDAIREKAIDYFIQCGYGQDFYTEADIRKMFKELDAIGMLWPSNAKMKLIDRHAKWRNRYYKYWFRKWHNKIRRKP